MEKKRKVSVLFQVAVLFVIGVIVIGAVSAVALYRYSTRYVRERLETQGSSMAEDLRGYIFDFPAHEWLLRYWCEHYDEMEIEYDAIYGDSTETEEKYALLISNHMDFWVDYATQEEVEALPEGDQKLYAEIVYSWLIDRVDYAKSAFGLDYLFCVVTEEPYDQQFVLFIAAGMEDVRGPEPGQIYPIGKTIKVTGEIQEAMRAAASGSPQAALSRDGKYYDYFYPLAPMDDQEALLVLTIDVDKVREAVISYLSDFGLLFAVLMIALAAGCLLMIYYLVLQPLKNVQEDISLYKETKNSKMLRSMPQ